MQAVALLLAIAQMVGEPVYCAADDFRNFFNQLKISPEDSERYDTSTHSRF